MIQIIGYGHRFVETDEAIINGDDETILLKCTNCNCIATLVAAAEYASKYACLQDAVGQELIKTHGDAADES